MNTVTPSIIIVTPDRPKLIGESSDLGVQYIHAHTLQFWLDSMICHNPEYFADGEYMDERVDVCDWLSELDRKGYRHPSDTPNFIFQA